MEQTKAGGHQHGNTGRNVWVTQHQTTQTIRQRQRGSKKLSTQGKRDTGKQNQGRVVQVINRDGKPTGSKTDKNTHGTRI